MGQNLADLLTVQEKCNRNLTKFFNVLLLPEIGQIFLQQIWVNMTEIGQNFRSQSHFSASKYIFDRNRADFWIYKK